MRIQNIFGTEFSGTIGKSMIASSWKGIPYMRTYTVPKDPKTELQLEHRALWARAVDAWHALGPDEKRRYSKAARRMTGYNLYIKEYIKAVREGREP